MTVRIALDAMGGDHAPHELVQGALNALAADPDLEVVLVGDRVRLETELARRGSHPRVSVHHAAEVVSMEEAAASVRKKRDASIVVAMDLVKQGHCQAVVAAGSTGAAMASALLRLGRLPGIERPAIAAVLPTLGGPLVLLDVGANVDSRPAYLRQFALMGDAYARAVLKIPSPRVALLNIGEEPGKGDELTVEAHQLLARTPQLSFVGNVEGRDLPAGKVDVAVCDGFVGNVALKLAEGMGGFITGLLRAEIARRGWRAALGAWLLRPTFHAFKKRLDYAEYGGALLLGVQGVCVISHGSSQAPAIVSALRVAREAVHHQALELVATAIASSRAEHEA